MYISLQRTLIGHFELEAHFRPPSLAGQFKIETNATNMVERQERLRAAAMIVGALLVLPGVLAVAFGVLKYNLGFPNLYDPAFASSAFVFLAKVSLFLGTPLALLLNVLTVLHLRWNRQPDGISTSVTLEPTLMQLLVLVVAFLVTAVFFGHLVVDGFACFRGVKSAC